MFASLVLLGMLKPLVFPPQPIPSEVVKGEGSGLRREPLAAVLRDDQAFLGYWFDGRRHRYTDDAVLVSPGLVSRWLGYLRGRERWPDGELERRWRLMRTMLDGRITFVVRLASLPKQDPLELGVDAPPQPEEIDRVRIVVSCSSYSPANPPSSAIQPFRSFSERIVRRQGRDLAAVAPIPFHRYLPQLAPLIGEFEEPIWPGWEIPLGDHHSALYLVEAELPERLRADAIQIRVFSPRRERVGSFPIFSRPNVKSRT